MDDKYKEVPIQQKYLDLFRELIHTRLGIYIARDKDYLLQSKLSRLLKQSHYKGIEQYYNDVKNGDIDSMERLIRNITTTHTFFFREHTHLKILHNDILIKKNTSPLIWCAASSTGEEVYSIIIDLLEKNITNFKIVASDINKEVLHKLKKGVYSAERIKNVSIALIEKYFTDYEEDGTHYYKVKPFLKNYFIIKKLNLVEPIFFEGKFDYIFCRNVLIYFDRETQKQVLDNLLNNLKDLGYLFVGQSECLLNISKRIESVFSSVYNKL